MNDKTQPQKNRKLLAYGIIFALLMFAFGFALVPLYDVFCNVFGINGKTDATPAAVYSAAIDKTRSVRVEFLASMGDKSPFTFKAKTRSIEIHPGQSKKVYFIAHNTADHNATVRAIPSVAPGYAAKYLKKTECFCFQKQDVAAGKTVEMPMVFHLDTNLPKDVHTVTLSYTMFNASEKPSIKKPVGKIS